MSNKAAATALFKSHLIFCVGNANQMTMMDTLECFGTSRMSNDTQGSTSSEMPGHFLVVFPDIGWKPSLPDKAMQPSIFAKLPPCFAIGRVLLWHMHHSFSRKSPGPQPCHVVEVFSFTAQNIVTKTRWLNWTVLGILEPACIKSFTNIHNSAKVSLWRLAQRFYNIWLVDVSCLL